MNRFVKAINSFFLLTIASVLLSIYLFTPQYALAQTISTGDIAGTITDTNGNGISNIAVTAYASVNDFSNNNPLGSAYTDINGNYDVSGLPGGSYILFINQQGGGNPTYAQEFYDGQPSINTVNLVTVTSGQTTNNINMQLPFSAHISGKVTDANGNPVPNIRVAFYGSISDYYAWQVGTKGLVGGWVMTGADGIYQMDFLPEGSYLVTYNQNDDVYNSNYTTDYYNYQPSIGMANPVTVTAGETISGIDGHLTAPGEITGKVTDKLGNSIPNVKVWAYASLADYNNGIVANARRITSTDGTYDIQPMHEGNYIIVFNPDLDAYYQSNYETQFYNDQPTVDTTNIVSVTPGTTTENINAILGEFTPNNKDQCKKEGWKNFIKPSFKNQGQCVSFVEHNKQ